MLDVHGEYMHSRENGSPTGNVPLSHSTLVCCQKFFPHIAIYHATLLQSKCMGLLWTTLIMSKKIIVRHIEQTYQYTISYLKAWRAKQRVFEMRFGTYEASYDNLPRMLSQIAARNPGNF